MAFQPFFSLSVIALAADPMADVGYFLNDIIVFTNGLMPNFWQEYIDDA